MTRGIRFSFSFCSRQPKQWHLKKIIGLLLWTQLNGRMHIAYSFGINTHRLALAMNFHSIGFGIFFFFRCCFISEKNRFQGLWELILLAIIFFFSFSNGNSKGSVNECSFSIEATASPISRMKSIRTIENVNFQEQCQMKCDTHCWFVFNVFYFTEYWKCIDIQLICEAVWYHNWQFHLFLVQHFLLFNYFIQIFFDLSPFSPLVRHLNKEHVNCLNI